MSENNETVNDHVKFILEADKVIVERGKVYDFGCPICGGKAMGRELK